ncbi:hypothetical protein BKA70DRAFT_732389 [Coprinopsis sp. MPI-PUGE-AT-0042]|nr:hypothetical protein BKA70DRAFT_732389 [Coprinopsis sp. MPI-PUGE-AT-0042]
MIAKLDEELIKMEIDLEEEISQWKTARVPGEGERPDDGWVRTVEATEKYLRQQHAEAITRLRSDMERNLEKEIATYAEGTPFGLHSDPFRGGTNDRALRGEGGATEYQSAFPVSNADMCKRESPSTEEVDPRLSLTKTNNPLKEGISTRVLGSTTAQKFARRQDRQQQSTQMFTDVSQSDDSPRPKGKQEFLSKSKAKRGTSSSSRSSTPPRGSAADPPLPHPPVVLDPRSLGISHTPGSLVHIRSLQSTRTTPGVPQQGPDVDSQVLANSHQPGGTIFHGTDQLQVHGGSFVAASTVINNTYYITNFHGSPSPCPSPSNGGTRPRSMEL